MKNKKLLKVVTTGFLAFSMTTQTVSASTPFVLDLTSDNNIQFSEEAIALADLIKVEDSQSSVEEILSNTYVRYSDKDSELEIYGNLSESLSIRIETSDDLLELTDEFNTTISSIELNNQLEMILVEDSKEIKTIQLTLSEASEKEDYEDIVEEVEVTDEEVEVIDEDVEIKEDEVEESHTSPEKSTLEDSQSQVETETDVEEIPEFTYDIDTSNEESLSMPRFQEVEMMLHGQEELTSTFTMNSFLTTSSSRTHNGGVYTVVSGDTFNSIASSFNISSTQLRHWNTHVTNPANLTVGTRLAVTRQGVESMLSQADKDRLHKGSSQAEFTLPQEFIDFIAPMAVEVANQEGVEGLYPSLMIAQAAHESNYGRSSLGAPPYHNLSGIKGNHNGQSVLMWTWEVFDGVRVDVLAGFRNYPSYTASLQDYANLLRNGLSWNRNYYSGTWRSNTKDVWDVLDNKGLAGYATDPRYYDAMYRIINQYDLTQFDSGNFYVRTGTFFGEPAVQNNMNRLKQINPNMVYRYEQSSADAYRNRRVEAINEFVGEQAAQRAVNQIKADQGWHASFRETGNSTNHVRVQSGFFNTKQRAERAVEEFREETGWFATIEEGNDGRFRLRTGFYVGEESAQRAISHMENLGWFARTVETGASTPHFAVYTGVFPNPSAVSRAHDYFSSRGWGSKDSLVNRYTHFYRVFVEGFPSERQATNFVSEVNNRFGWHSAAFPVK